MNIINFWIFACLTFGNFINLELPTKLLQQKFWHLPITSKLSHIGDVNVTNAARAYVAYFSNSRRWMETIQEPTYLIHKEHSQNKYPCLRYPQQTRKLQPSTPGTKAIGETYLQISAEKKMEMGHCAAEYGVLARVRDYTTKLPVPLTNMGLAYWAACIHEMILTKL